jgi:transcription factor TFIIIB component B''
VRKDKGTRRKAPVTEEGEDGAVGAPRQKPKKARKKRTPMAPTEGGEGEGEQAEPRPRGRRKRGPTPDDAEEYEVTPDTSMATLAARDPRRGKLSTREKAMREIDWDEVKRRRQERALEIAQNGGGANAAEVDERLNHAANERSAANEVPQLNYDEHGNIAINPDSLFSDRRAEATQDEDVLELRVEDDLTRRFNMHSHLRDNRRDPVDRVMGAPQKWTIDATNEFYNALTIFGTDFSMIATLFPNKTRRHCKHKFGREERLDPERIKEALMGRKDNPVSFEQYLKMSGKDASTFKDPRALEAELKAIDDDNQIAIEKAREEYEKVQKNRQLAGVEPSGEQATAEGGEEGATEKRRKKERKKSKGRPVGGEEVEILETIDD